jgi:hypothetical protein
MSPIPRSQDLLSKLLRVGQRRRDQSANAKDIARRITPTQLPMVASLAILRNWPEVLELCLARGLDPDTLVTNQLEKDGRFTDEQIAQWESLAMLDEATLPYSARLHGTHMWEMKNAPLLMVAAMLGRWGMMEMLLDAGANANADVLRKNNNAWTTLEVLATLNTELVACPLPDDPASKPIEAIVRRLVSMDAIVNREDTGTVGALELSLAWSATPVLKVFLEKPDCVGPLYWGTMWRDTPLGIGLKDFFNRQQDGFEPESDKTSECQVEREPAQVRAIVDDALLRLVLAGHPVECDNDSTWRNMLPEQKACLEDLVCRAAKAHLEEVLPVGQDAPSRLRI